MDLAQDLITALAPHGFNLIGTASVAAYEALAPERYHIRTLLPGAKTAVVIGNGGGAFWAGFRAHCKARPGYLHGREHPLDDYTVEIIESALTSLLEGTQTQYRYVYPFRFWAEPVSIARERWRFVPSPNRPRIRLDGAGLVYAPGPGRRARRPQHSRGCHSPRVRPVDGAAGGGAP